MACVALNAHTGKEIRCYRLADEVKLIEDKTTEFKMHSVVSDEYIGRNQYGTLKPFSHTLNAFLNTQGGTLYCGISDRGHVKGYHLSGNQKLHMRMKLQDLFNRFTPPVRKDQISVQFVPVLYPDEPNYVPDPVRPSLQDIRRPHLMRSSEDHCWCDLEAKARKELGLIHPLYVIEISVEAGDRFHAAEDGKYFLRGTSSNTRYDLKSLQELADIKKSMMA